MIIRNLFLSFIAFAIFSIPVRSEILPNLNSYSNENSAAPEKDRPMGRIIDANGEAIIGASVVLKSNPKVGTVTDIDGNFTFPVSVKSGEILQCSFLGYSTVEKKFISGKELNIIMYEDVKSLEGVEVVAFGTQKKESIIGAISTINVKDLKVPSSNLTTSLAGRVAGMISYQRSGEPGKDDASFFIRGITTFGANTNPLILIDNVELTTKDLAMLQPDDIASFSIMKDATATALYGARGANGVILVTTKQGVAGKPKVNFRFEGSFSQPTKNIELADPITYMNMHNEAILTRNPLGESIYSKEKIDRTLKYNDPMLYPVTDWRKELLNNFTFNQRYNLNISGGGNVARYYVAGSFADNNGLLKVNGENNFNNNIKVKDYTLRSNVNINISKITELIVRMSGTFSDYNGPITSGEDIYKKILLANPVMFPAVYQKDDAHQYIEHTMFGNADQGQYLNPYAQMVRGYRETGRSNLSSQMELKQGLDFITKGLSARALMSVGRISYYQLGRSYNPTYYKIIPDYVNNTYTYDRINDNGTDYLELDPKLDQKTIDANLYIEAALNYQRSFKKHDVSALLVYQQREKSKPNAGTLQASLPYHNLGLSGRATYSFDKKYFVEYNFGYNGSERFDKDHRWGFFPSAGLAWLVSNESFMKPLSNVITMMKLRGSYGIVGNDNIGSDRFIYLSEVTMNDSKYGYQFGTSGTNYNGVSINRYPDKSIAWETSYKTNYALELSLFNKLNIVAEYYTEHRKNILQARSTIPSSMGLAVTPYTSIGEAKGHGIDLTADYGLFFNAGKSWLQFRGNFTWAKSEYLKTEEYVYPNEPWKSLVGNSLAQRYGYIAEGLFIDDNEVSNSPTQFGDYMAGDIKYRDMNKDGVISDLDMVPLGYPATPEIVYGFGVSVGHKNFDLSVFFQGLANESFFISYYNMNPFFSRDGGQNTVSKFIADSYWNEETRNSRAVWPRLSAAYNGNNAQPNTWFMRDGSFLRLKQLEFGYTLPESLLSKAKVKSLRLYLSGSNLLCFSKFKEWDIEMAGDGLGYPVQRVYNIGLNLTF